MSCDDRKCRRIVCLVGIVVWIEFIPLLFEIMVEFDLEWMPIALIPFE